MYTTCTWDADAINVLPRALYDYTNLRARETIDVVVADEIALGGAMYNELVIRVYSSSINDAAEGWVDVVLEGIAPSAIPAADVYSTGTVARARLGRVASGTLVRTVVGWDTPAFARLHLVMCRATTAPTESIELAVDLHRPAHNVRGLR